MSQVRVVPHRESWKGDFASEAVAVADALGVPLDRLHHIGSTAIPGIHAKPVIDMLAEVEDLVALDARRSAMEHLGYEAMGEFGIPGRRYFRKDTAGVRTHQIHAFVAGSPDVLRHLAFRDYLRCHPDVAREYDALKRRVADACNGDLVAYMKGKDGFIKQTERAALDWYAARREAD